MRQRLCREPDCWVYFTPSKNQIYCGSAKKKTGCSYKNRLRLNAKWNKAHKTTLNAISRRWLERNRELRNAYRRTPEYHLKVKKYKINKYLALQYERRS